MTRLLFVSAFDYPTKYAHARHGLEMAKAYHALLGDNFLFLVNTTRKPLPVPYRLLFGPFGRRIKLLRLRRLLVPIRLFLFFLLNPRWRAIVATDPVLFAPLVFFKRLFAFKLLFECHGSLTARQARALQGADLVVFTTRWLKDQYPGVRGIIASNAADVDAFRAVGTDQRALRSELDLPQGFLIGYIGRFAPLKTDKGLRFLIDSLVSLPDVQLALIGGSRQEIPAYEEYARTIGVRDRTHFVAHVDASLIPKYAQACDTLAYVPSERSQFFEHETSPMKVFEYMAAERPIILSDTPALREILDESSAYFIKPGSQSDFAEAIGKIRRGEGAAKARVALEKVRINTWEHRAKNIVQALFGVL